MTTQNSSGTANSVNVASGQPPSQGTNGAANLLGGGQISSEGSCMTQAPAEYPYAGSSFGPTQTIKQSSG